MSIRLLLLTIYFVTVFTASATTYYFSASGNDANNGTSVTTPWKTLSRFNSVFASSGSAGDNFLFKRGDVFYGRMVISNSGLAASPITIGAYGTGAMPVITGLTSVSDWTNLGDNIWESTGAVSTLSYTNMVVVNGVNTAMGRYPNTGFLTYQSHDTNSITSTSLTGSSDWTGAEAAISNTPFTIIRCPIIAQSGGTITCINEHSIPDTTFNRPGTFFVPNFFIQNDPRTLDVTNEWYYNHSTKKIRIFNNVSPSNVQVSTIDTLVYINTKSYIMFNGISFQGANSSAIEGRNSPHIVVINCGFDFSGKNCIHGSLNYMKIEKCTINHTNSNAIDLANSTPDTIRLCRIANTGMIPMAMPDGPSNADAITTRGDNEIIEYNNIDNSGFCGVRFLGSNVIIQNNLINHSCMNLYDAGGIYTFNSCSLPRTGIKILNNIVLNTPSKNGGIYMDDHSNEILIQGNTVAFTGIGIYLHNAWNIEVRDNTAYSNDHGIMSNWNDAGVTQNNLTVKNNIFFAKTATQKPANYYTLNVAAMPRPFTSDSNYYARPIDDNLTVQTVFNGSTVTQRSLSDWQTLNSQEAHSHKSPKPITNTDDFKFEYNETLSDKTISLDTGYIDVSRRTYHGTITLAPFTSVVLIRSGH